MGRPGFDIDNKRRVLDATDITRLIGEHLNLKPKGREYVCLCPFHDDHNPSMHVIPAKQIYYCFVCGAGGNAIDFVMRHLGMGFREALQLLADRAGIVLEFARRSSPDGAPGEEDARSSREELLEANLAALRFYRGVLAHAEHGVAARDMVRARGIAPEMVEAFCLGAAPKMWDGLVQYINSKHLDPRPFIDAGLIRKRPESGGFFDYFRDRLIFPIMDRAGRPVAFGGRRLNEEDEPKYLNSPESRVFDKSGTLFGLKQALKAIQEERTAVITEGYTDAIACHQAGFANVVATLGTALTPKHASALRGVCETVVLLFDSDEAGERAADRAIEVFFNEPVDLRIARVVGGKDPDEILKKEGGPEAFRAILRSSTDWLRHRFDRLDSRLTERGAEIGSVARAAAVEAEVNRLVELGLSRLPPIRRQTVIARLRHLAGVDASAVAQALERAERRATPPGSAGDQPATRRMRSALEDAVGCLLVEPLLARSHAEQARYVLEQAAYSSPPIATVAEAVSATIWRGEATPGLNDLLIEIDDDDVKSAAMALAVRIEVEAEGDHDKVAAHWRECVHRLNIDRYRASRDTASSAMERIEARRRLEERDGGNPLAYPRSNQPKVGTGRRDTRNGVGA